MLHVVFELALVDLSVWCAQSALALAGAVDELALIDIAVRPYVSSVAVRFALFINACVLVSVGELFLAFAALQEVLEVAAVFGAACVNVLALSMLPVVLPFAFVAISFRGFPYTVSILFSVFPVSFELLSVIPHIFSFPVSLAVQELA